MIKVIKSIYNAYDILISENIIYMSEKEYKRMKQYEELEQYEKSYYIFYEKA